MGRTALVDRNTAWNYIMEVTLQSCNLTDIIYQTAGMKTLAWWVTYLNNEGSEETGYLPLLGDCRSAEATPF